MNVYIQTNSKQFLASKVSAYSFVRFGHNVKLMNFEESEILKKYLGKKLEVFIRKVLPEFESPEYVNSNNYVRTGNQRTECEKPT